MRTAWEGRKNEVGLAKGVYLYRIVVGAFTATKKILFLMRQQATLQETQKEFRPHLGTPSTPLRQRPFTALS